LIASSIESWLIWEVLAMVARLILKKSTPEPARDETTNVDVRKVNTFASQGSKWSVKQTFWSMVQWAFLTVTVIRHMINTVILSRSLPSRAAPLFIRQMDMTALDANEKARDDPGRLELHSTPIKVPVADFHIWPCLANLLEMDIRMPWLCGALSMAQWGATQGPVKLAGFDSLVDR
jgi:splicing suppressor protein 51